MVPKSCSSTLICSSERSCGIMYLKFYSCFWINSQIFECIVKLIGCKLHAIWHCWSVHELCTMIQMEDGSLGELWKTACCIDCVCFVNGILFESMLVVIKWRQKATNIQPTICSALTCSLGCSERRWKKRKTVRCVLTGTDIASLCYLVIVAKHDWFIVLFTGTQRADFFFFFLTVLQ